MPITTGMPDSKVSLMKLNEAINEVRNTLMKYTIEKNAALNNKGNKAAEAEEEETYLQLLSQIVNMKMMQDKLLNNVEKSRQNIKERQDELVKARLKLDNLEYEKKLLQNETQQYRNVQSPYLKQTKVSIPKNLFNSSGNVDDGGKDLKIANDNLNTELKTRRELQNQVEQIMKQIDSKKISLTKLKNDLKKLPSQIQSIHNVVQPVQTCLSPNEKMAIHDSYNSSGNHVGSKHELALMDQLPLPLYILSRQAIAFRQAFDNDLLVEINKNKKFSNDKDNEIDDQLYKLCDMNVTIEIGQGNNKSDISTEKNHMEIDNEKEKRIEKEEIIMDTYGAKLRITFKYLENLSIIVVDSAMIVDGQVCDEYPLKELRTLYPYDKGDTSPRPAHNYLNNGEFQFDIKRANGRAFIWANLLGGIECIPEIPNTLHGGSGKKWPNEMGKMLTHLKFSEVVTSLKRRLVSIVHLKRQVDGLMGKPIDGSHGMIIKPHEIGLKFNEEITARVGDFVRLSKKDWCVKTDDGINKKDDDDDDMEVWSIRVIGGKGVTLSCMIGIEADYPLVRPMVRLKMEGGIEGMTERDVTELERSVNEFEWGSDSKLSGRDELILGAQITTLVISVHKLEALIFSNKPQLVGTGRTRVKVKDLIK